MSFPAVLVPAILLLAGGVYFFAHTRESDRWEGKRFEQAGMASVDDMVADESDRVVVRTLLESPGLSETQTNSLILAAGRRYMRRKMAYIAAKQAADAGTGPVAAVEPLRREMESARKVCDVAQSVWRNREWETMAQADFDLEIRLARGTGVGLAEHFQGSSAFTAADLAELDRAFQKQFGKPLPVSTRGESAVHRAMGFDHTGRFDVAVSPSQPEGLWTRRYLTEKHVTFLAFNSAVPGKATGAHIHIGPPSTHRTPTSQLPVVAAP